MEENRNDNIQPTPPRRRRKRSKWQDFKEAYLPVLIVLVAVILIITFIAGAISRGGSDEGKAKETTEPSVDTSALLQQEQDSLLSKAAALAAQYDYEEAIKVLSSYSAGVNTSEVLLAKIQEYQSAFDQLVPFTDIENIPHLSVNLLIQDMARALADADYGTNGSGGYSKNYITTSEFKNILQELYGNGYMLVSLYDIAPVSADGSITRGTLYLPAGKKPLVLSQTGTNYFTYMVDGDGDGLADKSGDGFASRLIVDASGKLVNEMVDAEGNTVTGAFDLIPILDEFVAAHPDFSYRGAKATIALTGYDGLFGYRTDPETAEKISQEYYNEQIASVGTVINAVKASGYDLACYTYEMVRYDGMSSTEIQADLQKWTDEVKPLLGDVDILIYPWGSDIGDGNEYSGNKYIALNNFGFKYYIGMDNSTDSWGQLTGSYYRQSRRWVTGTNLDGDMFSDLFDSSKVIDAAARGIS